MAPNNFEDQVREKLQERTLAPKKESWELLSQQLGAQSPAPKKRSFLWVAVAASFVGLLLLGTWFFSQESEPQLVEENPVDVLLEETPLEIKSEIASETTLEIETPSSKEIIETLPETSNKEPLLAERKKEVVENTKTPSVVKENNAPKEMLAVNTSLETTSETPKETPKQKTFIDQKVDEVVVAVQQIQQQNNEVTLEEIDALLVKAQRDISNQKLLQSTTAKVDASALLKEVEFELERSFRDKVFDALGDGFQKVRTAMAERNY